MTITPEEYVAQGVDSLNKDRAYSEARSQAVLRLVNAVRDGDPITSAALTLGTPSYGLTWRAPYGSTREQLVEWLQAARDVFDWLGGLPEFSATKDVAPAKGYGTDEKLCSTLAFTSERFAATATIHPEAQYTPRDRCTVVATGETRTEIVEVTKRECVPGAETGAAWEALGLAVATLDESKLVTA